MDRNFTPFLCVVSWSVPQCNEDKRRRGIRIYF